MLDRTDTPLVAPGEEGRQVRPHGERGEGIGLVARSLPTYCNLF